MKKILPILLFATLLFTGCVKTVGRQELDAAIHSHDHETVSWVSYVGSRDGYHYILHSHTVGSDMYRIAESGLKIEAPFPLTKDQGKWRPLKKNGEVWGLAEMITSSQSGLRKVNLVAGMKRLDAERIIADATGVKSKYDLYAMDASREVRYRDGTTVLVVRYKPGSPAPWVKMPDGHAEHLPPMDGEVLSWEFLSEAAEGAK